MIDWTTTALVFPGQGAQEVGMGHDLVSSYPAAREVFEQADDILGFSLSRICFDGPAEQLNDTINTQPALFVMGIALARVLETELGTALQPAFMAGHSLGEFTALAAARALPFQDGLQLVRERGRLMKEAGEHSPGAMAAILGLDSETVVSLCADASAQTGQPLVPANDNCPGQIVISGDSETLDIALSLATERGARRAVKLAVSVASHSPLMSSITASFRAVLDATPFHPPATPVVGNVNAAPLHTVDEVRDELSAQLVSTVRWTESVQYMRQEGVSLFVELGPKDVLSGLIKRIDRAAQRVALNSAASLSRFLEH